MAPRSTISTGISAAAGDAGRLKRRGGMATEGTSFEYKGPNTYCKLYSKYLKGSASGVSGVEEVVLRGVAGTVKTTVKTDRTAQLISRNICYSDMHIYTLLVDICSILVNSSANTTHELNVC